MSDTGCVRQSVNRCCIGRFEVHCGSAAPPWCEPVMLREEGRSCLREEAGRCTFGFFGGKCVESGSNLNGVLCTLLIVGIFVGDGLLAPARWLEPRRR